MIKPSEKHDNYRPKTEREFSEEDVLYIYSMVDLEQGYGIKYIVDMLRFNRKTFAEHAQGFVDSQEKE